MQTDKSSTVVEIEWRLQCCLCCHLYGLLAEVCWFACERKMQLSVCADCLPMDDCNDVTTKCQCSKCQLPFLFLFFF